VERPGHAGAAARWSWGASVVCLDKRPGVRPRIDRPEMAVALRLPAPRRGPHAPDRSSVLYRSGGSAGSGNPCWSTPSMGWRTTATCESAVWGGWPGHLSTVFYCLTETMAGRRGRPPDCSVPSKQRTIDNGIDNGEVFLAPSDALEIRRTLGIPGQAPVHRQLSADWRRSKQHEPATQSLCFRCEARVAGVRLLLVGDGPLPF